MQAPSHTTSNVDLPQRQLPFNLFHPALFRKPIGESCLNWNGSLIRTLYLLEIYELPTESEESLELYGGLAIDFR